LPQSGGNMAQTSPEFPSTESLHGIEWNGCAHLVPKASGFYLERSVQFVHLPLRECRCTLVRLSWQHTE
jgi:hypothetical protein